MKNSTRSVVFLSVIFFTAFFTPYASSCTRILNVTHDAVLVGRNMDWLEDMHANLWVYPRGIKRYGDNSKHPLAWVSQYGSIVATVYDNVLPTTTDGLNEAGLSAHILSLPESDYGTRDESLPTLSVLMWAQFYLDNFKTVDEAVQFTNTNVFQVIPFYYPKLQKWINLHLVLDDASGDSAIFEYVNGHLQIYHDKSFTALTNSPSFDLQLQNLKKYSGFGGTENLPGTTIAADRFVRASYYTAHLNKDADLQTAISSVLSVLNNVAQPFGLPSAERPKISTTIWRTIADLTHKVYYYQAINGGLIWADLSKFNLETTAVKMKLDVDHHPDLVGDVSDRFEKV